MPFLYSLWLVVSVGGFFTAAPILLNHYNLVSSGVWSTAVIVIALTGLTLGWNKRLLYHCTVLSMLGGIEVALYNIRHPDPLEKLLPGVSGSLVLSTLAIAIALILGVVGFRKRTQTKTT